MRDLGPVGRALRTVVIASTALMAVGAGATAASAQPENREREPTGSASVDPCARFGLAPQRDAATPPGFDARLPAPRGATSFTGVGRMAREPSAMVPAPSAPPGPTSPTDPAYQDCVRQTR